jgi:hypothetical protein
VTSSGYTPVMGLTMQVVAAQVGSVRTTYYMEGSQAYAQLIQEQKLPEPPSAQDASAAKAKLGRMAGSRGIYGAKVPAQMTPPNAACIVQVLLCKAVGPPFPSTDQVVMNAACAKQLMFIARESKLSGSNTCAAEPFGCIHCHLAQSQ